jgi:hypothetical protein
MIQTPMNLQQITAAVDAGRTVHWQNGSYIVRKGPSHPDTPGSNRNPALRYTIDHTGGGSIGLTWRDGTTLNGKECDFYAAD